MTKVTERNKPEILSSNSIHKLKQQIDKSLRVKDVEVLPQLIEGCYNGYNIFSFASVYLACEQSRHELNIDLIRKNDYGRCYSGETINDVKRLIDNAGDENNEMRREHVLLVCNTSPAIVQNIIDQLHLQDVTLLIPRNQHQTWPRYPIIDFSEKKPTLVRYLKDQNFDAVIVPYGSRLGTIQWEKFVSLFANRMLAIFSDENIRLYKDNHLSRLCYNMAYLRSMFQLVPELKGKRILEVGCSDGLTCDLLSHEKPEAISGIDILETVGLLYQNPIITYHKMNAEYPQFDDETFDLCYSIATFEHVADPFRAVTEMRRVTKPGGYCYIQAGPLYYSPFGHHMFGYFDEYPWIHLRLSKEDIVEYCKQKGIDGRLRSDRGISAEEYVYAMINTRHINGKLLSEYKLDQFMSCPDIEVLSFTKTYEGKSLINEKVISELNGIAAEDLVTHGFELVFKVK